MDRGPRRLGRAFLRELGPILRPMSATNARLVFAFDFARQDLDQREDWQEGDEVVWGHRYVFRALGQCISSDTSVAPGGVGRSEVDGRSDELGSRVNRHYQNRRRRRRRP